MEEWVEVEQVRSEVVTKLNEYLDEEPDHPPEWWTDEWKSDAEGALLCLLMTGVSEPGVAKWFTEKIVSVVCHSVILTVAKRKEMGEEDSRRIRCNQNPHPRTCNPRLRKNRNRPK